MSGQVVVEELGSTRQSTDGSITPVSPSLANEQSQDENCLLVDSDRIPSHVFAATSTTSPAEWSTASNESLFSIHPMNASFTKDQFNWMSKSGDFGFNCDSLNISSPLMELPRNMLSPEITTRNGSFNKGEGEFGASASAAEAMREVLQEKECQQKDNVATGLSPHSRSLSTHSDASVRSFAFPILTGDADKSGSLTKDTKTKKQQSQHSTNHKETPDNPPETPKLEPSQDILKSQTQKPNRNTGFKRWCTCFSCCPSCS
ncbi:Assimilatory nitrate reductase catalytic subunit [Gossypium arboreum]|uniref:Assimilatory nitrate reductase catalytic subunit n=1 Tax=Gossypium arboreum TaxID=29729 RepID=A0A0B0NYS4_GOSAR|nr:Assimilatory nitrate reductase catalytic subunit [Gossypium arboreum]